MAKNKQIDGQLSLEDLVSFMNASEADNKEDDDALFEKEYERLIRLFNKVKTDNFDPMRYLMAIANGVKTSISEKIDFKDALSHFVSESTTEMIATGFIGDNEKELFDIIGSMHDEI